MAVASEIERGLLGLAAEYAVASVLCRRGIYAQLTLGHQKKTDLLVFSDAGEVARLEVKAKQKREWPNCRGISGPNVFLVFVDFEGRASGQPPDFFVLSVKEWRRLVERRVKSLKAKNPKMRLSITDENVCVFEDQIGRSGQTYKGIGVRVPDVSMHRDAWGKVTRALSAG